MVSSGRLMSDNNSLYMESVVTCRGSWDHIKHHIGNPLLSKLANRGASQIPRLTYLLTLFIPVHVQITYTDIYL